MESSFDSLSLSFPLFPCSDVPQGSGSWTNQAQLSEARSDFSAVAYDDVIYICGGLDSNNNVLDACISYDTVTRQYNEVKLDGSLFLGLTTDDSFIPVSESGPDAVPSPPICRHACQRHEADLCYRRMGHCGCRWPREDNVYLRH